MSEITSLVASFSGNVTYRDGSVGSFAAILDEAGNVSFDSDNHYDIYAMLSDTDTMTLLNMFLFGDRGGLQFFVSPSPFSEEYKTFNDFHCRLDGSVAFADGTSDSFALVFSDFAELVISDNLQELFDKILLDDAALEKYSTMLDCIFGQGICTISRNDDPPFVGENVLFG